MNEIVDKYSNIPLQQPTIYSNAMLNIFHNSFTVSDDVIQGLIIGHSAIKTPPSL